MTRMPRVTGDHVVRSLRKAGFEVIRQRGSHVIMKHPDGRGTVVPVHGGETLGVGLMSKIQKDAGVDKEAFIALLRGSQVQSRSLGKSRVVTSRTIQHGLKLEPLV